MPGGLGSPGITGQTSFWTTRHYIRLIYWGFREAREGICGCYCPISDHLGWFNGGGASRAEISGLFAVIAISPIAHQLQSRIARAQLAAAENSSS
jgi:hypothetical protein